MRRGFAGALKWLSPLLGFVATGAVAGGTVPPSAAPASWLRYAEGVTTAVAQWLEGGEQGAAGIRDRLVTEGARAGQDRPLILRLWIQKDRVSQVSLASPEDAQADADLRTFLMGRRFDMAMPKNMRQPLNISVQLMQKSGE
ncbi:MAG TPA: hypothetical protein VF503_08685 [Sphingobium sp.]|uniref:hypothetical protein n=1 Tax=Sphingobium sp. TaxID=1912891 RepID=UPI002ED34512